VGLRGRISGLLIISPDARVNLRAFLQEKKEVEELYRAASRFALCCDRERV
jgi:hypothetical protein